MLDINISNFWNTAKEGKLRIMYEVGMARIVSCPHCKGRGFFIIDGSPSKRKLVCGMCHGDKVVYSGSLARNDR